MRDRLQNLLNDISFYSNNYNLISGHTRGFPKEKHELYASILSAVGGRHLFITTKGFLDVGCNDIYAGDFVCVLFDGKEPFILRRMQTYVRSDGEPNTQFAFFGAAYVPGIIDGEALKDQAKHWVLYSCDAYEFVPPVLHMFSFCSSMDCCTDDHTLFGIQ